MIEEKQRAEPFAFLYIAERTTAWLTRNASTARLNALAFRKERLPPLDVGGGQGASALLAIYETVSACPQERCSGEFSHPALFP